MTTRAYLFSLLISVAAFVPIFALVYMVVLPLVERIAVAMAR